MSLEFADVFDCVDCGAQVRFRSDDDGDLLERAACPYCGVVNDRALAILRQQAAEARRHEKRAAARRQQVVRFVAVAFATFVLLIGIAIWQAGSELAALHAEVDRAHAQVQNVRERQAATLRQWARRGTSPDRDAEISGAENRVRVERARYDAAAADYNAAAAGPWGGLCAKVHGLPHQVRLSNEVHW